VCVCVCVCVCVRVCVFGACVCARALVCVSYFADSYHCCAPQHIFIAQVTQRGTNTCVCVLVCICVCVCACVRVYVCVCVCVCVSLRASSQAAFYNTRKSIERIQTPLPISPTHTYLDTAASYRRNALGGRGPSPFVSTP